MLRRIRQLSELSQGEWWWLSMAMVLLPLIGTCLRWFSFRRTQSLLRIALSSDYIRGSDDGTELIQAQTVARMVNIAAHHGPCQANCLNRSLVLQLLLGRAGIPAEIKFGIPVPAMKKFTAHAWVEYAGINLSDFGKEQQCAEFAC